MKEFFSTLEETPKCKLQSNHEHQKNQRLTVSNHIFDYYKKCRHKIIITTNKTHNV